MKTISESEYNEIVSECIRKRNGNFNFGNVRGREILLIAFLDTNLQERYYQEYIKHLIHSLHK